MKIKKLQIRNIRNHQSTEMELLHSVNIFWGLNGAGKTSILEAVAIAGLSKSFLPINDSTIINREASDYSISLSAVNDLSLPYLVKVKYSKGGKKEISNSYSDNLLPKDIIGEIPLVILSPDYKEITFGSPQSRRDFIDRILSQSHKVYLEEWVKLKKILKQRSAILGNYQKTRIIDLDLFSIWTNMLIDISTNIIYRRAEFINTFSDDFCNLYREISNDKETVSVKYRAFDIKDTSNKKIIKEQLESRAIKYHDDELKRGANLFGPQRDDLKFIINNGVAKDYASQGQHKSLLIAIKFAEFRYLKQILNETPIIILDDIFSELDNERIEKVLDLVKFHNAQTLISVNFIDFIHKLNLNEDYRLFNVIDGNTIERSIDVL